MLNPVLYQQRVVASGDEGLAMVSIRRVISFTKVSSVAALIAHNHRRAMHSLQKRI